MPTNLMHLSSQSNVFMVEFFITHIQLLELVHHIFPLCLEPLFYFLHLLLIRNNGGLSQGHLLLVRVLTITKFIK